MHSPQQFRTLAAGKRDASSNTKEPTLSTLICKDQGMFKESSEWSKHQTPAGLFHSHMSEAVLYCMLWELGSSEICIFIGRRCLCTALRQLGVS